MENIFASLSDFLFGILCFVVDCLGLPLVFPLIICLALHYAKKNPDARKHSDYGEAMYYNTSLDKGAIIAELKNLNEATEKKSNKHSDYGWSTYYGTDLATGAIIAELKNLEDSLRDDK